MADLKEVISEFYTLEQLSSQDTSIGRLHTAVKLILTAIYVVVVISFDRYDFSGLVPYIFYPIIMIALGEIPYSVMIKRVAITIPFCFFAGVGNLFFDRTALFTIAGMSVSGGVVSLVVILLKAGLTVSAVLILIATTPFVKLTTQLKRFRVPQILIQLFEITYRYIGTLIEEALSMYTAYKLRSGEKKGILIRDMGSFVGQFFIKSFDRSERVYNAMKCRGYGMSSVQCTAVIGKKKDRLGGDTLKRGDYLVLSVVSGLILIFRFFNVYSFLNG